MASCCAPKPTAAAEPRTSATSPGGAYGVAVPYSRWGDFRAALSGAAGAAARHPSKAKAWLEAEVAAGRLRQVYLPLDLDALAAGDRAQIDPLIARSGPEHFAEMSAAIRNVDTGQMREALRYMVLNDHMPEVREFLTSDWLQGVLSRELTDEQDGHFVGGMGIEFISMSDEARKAIETFVLSSTQGL